MTAGFSRLILLGCLLASSGAAAQTYPARPVTIIVTTAPGALTDVLSRAVGQRLAQKWKQTVVIENKPGGAYAIAGAAVAKATPDGYTLLTTEIGMFTTQPHLHIKGRHGYDAQADFVPVANIARIATALVTHPSVPAKSVAELIALAKAKPGTINYGTTGPGTAPHMSALLLESLAGIKLSAVHYRGVSLALNDVIAGHIDMIMMGPSIALPNYREGKLKILGMGSAKRLPHLAEIPTIAETVPGFESSVSFGLFAPAKTPPEIVAKINADVQEILADPAFRSRFLDPQVLEPMPGAPDVFARYLNSESSKWLKVIRDHNLRID
jgi:tripartite-type tricarboxylate transporter receptor subunit TctC